MRIERTKVKNIKYVDFYQFLWQELFAYSNRYSCFTQLKRRYPQMSSPMAENKSKDIGYALKLSKDYFDSARSSSMLSAPTLIYYGILNLVFALIIFKTNDKTLDNFARSHGLKLVSLPKNDADKKFFQFGIKVEETGTFPELLKIGPHDRTKISCTTRGIPSAYIGCSYISEEKPIVKTDYQLFELLSEVPEVWSEILNCQGITTKIYPGEMELLGDGRKILKFCIYNQHITRQKIEENFGILDHYTYHSSTLDYIFYQSQDSQAPYPVLKQNYCNESFFVSGTSTPLPDFVLYYLVFFIFGSIARYRATTWGDLVTNPKSRFLNMINILCDASIIKVPLLALSEFEESYINY